jgi:glycosyltransferase involved in cell wall biosynthesis
VADITLCLIARDEEAMLPGCLASVEGAVDRIVVVDTGSRDATREIARAHGARVLEHAWNDDFAAARNVGLAALDSGYVLVLDADERLAAGAAAALRDVVERGRPDLGLLPLHHASHAEAEPAAVLNGSARIGEPQLLPRLLRWTSDLRYEGIIHESVAGWARRGRKTLSVDAPIVHYGAVADRRAALAKAERNLRLLERRCAGEPGEPTPRAYLAAELRRLGLLPRALLEARASVDALRRARRRGARHHDPVLPVTIAVELMIRTGALDDAAALLREAEHWSEHPNLAFYAGLVAESRVLARGATPERLAEAEAHYRRAEGFGATLSTSELVPGAGSWAAALRLGTVQLLQGRAEEAAQSFERTLAHEPRQREARLGWVEARIAAGDSAGGLAALEPLLAEPDADAWLLAALGAHAAGAARDARAFLERAREARALRPFLARHREQKLLALERALAGATPELLHVFAWPRWQGGELTALLRDYGALLANRPGLVLCVRHDPKLDGPAPEAIAAFEAAYEQQLPAGSTLAVVLLDDAGTCTVPADARDVALALPGSDEEPRRGFLAGLRARRIASPAELARALAASG